MTQEQQKQNYILQPKSWETIVALEAQRSPEDFSSSKPSTIMHQVAQNFISNLIKKPTQSGMREFSRCLSVYEDRQKQWQQELDKQREEDEELHDELEETLATKAVKDNNNLASIVYFNEKKSYYQNLLLQAQKMAKANQSILAKLQKDLAPQELRSRFIEKLEQKAVVYTPQKLVNAITRGIEYCELRSKFALACAKEENQNYSFYDIAEETQETSQFNADIYQDFMQDYDASFFASELSALNFSKEEENLVAAWANLWEEFPVPQDFPNRQIASSIKTFKVEPVTKPAQTAVASAETFVDSSQRPIPSDLPILTELSPLPTVCKFLHQSSGDIAFAAVPKTSKEVKALFDKLLTPAMSQLYKRLDGRQKLSYKFARECLAASLKKFESDEAEVEEKQQLRKIALGHRG